MVYYHECQLLLLSILISVPYSYNFALFLCTFSYGFINHFFDMIILYDSTLLLLKC